MFTLRFVTAKFTVMKQQRKQFMVGGDDNMGSVLKGGRVRKVEHHCDRSDRCLHSSSLKGRGSTVVSPATCELAS